ncbi:MAG: hypothetical protein KGD73_11865 [Candidatus Lokiarchaeota archaeon]|nr:hypothetical protein [Candidatus Lokiarchaeota archaeon]
MVENDELVYLYGFSPRYSNRMENLISIIEEQLRLNAKIKVILIHDGVIGLSKKGIMPEVMKKLLNLSIKVYGMSPDLLARGINPEEIDSRIQCLDYDNLVDMLAITSNIASWM